jgi:hypothetical protein
MVPYVCECIQILRKHYPGRLGVACLYNTPPYWYPFWRIFCGLFDEEIMSKVCAELTPRRGPVRHRAPTSTQSP